MASAALCKLPLIQFSRWDAVPSAPGWPGCPVVFPLKFRNSTQFLILPLLPLLRAISRWQGGSVPPHDVSHQCCFPKLCVSRCPGLLRAHLQRDLPPTPPVDSGASLHHCVPRGAFLPVVRRLWRGLTCGRVRGHRRGSGLPLASPPQPHRYSAVFLSVSVRPPPSPPGCGSFLQPCLLSDEPPPPTPDRSLL